MMILLYVYLIAVIIDVAVMWRKLKKKLDRNGKRRKRTSQGYPKRRR